MLLLSTGQPEPLFTVILLIMCKIKTLLFCLLFDEKLVYLAGRVDVVYGSI